MFLFRSFYKIFISVKLAIFVIMGLALSLIVSTSLESIYDTPTAQYYVYRSVWFHLLLMLLALIIFLVAMSRYPFKKRHFPFLLAHAGILLLLGGAWVTEKFGVDGSVRVGEGEDQNIIEIDDPQIVISDGPNVKVYKMPWIPPQVKFKPISLSEFNLTVDQYISHADVDIEYQPVAEGKSKDDLVRSGGALLVNIQGGPMRVSQDFWLWSGDLSTSKLQAGAAQLILNAPAPIKSVEPLQEPKDLPGAWMYFNADSKDGSAQLVFHTKTGERVPYHLKASEINGKQIVAPWLKNSPNAITVTLKKWIPQAVRHLEYRQAVSQYGQMAPPSAIRLRAGEGGPGAEIWLGLYDRALLHVGNREVAIAYYPKQVVLPYAIRLEKFNIERYEGTQTPKSYSSQVQVVDGEARKSDLISMNEPLTYKGMTFYQSSYEDAMPRPTVSILSVNRDPGRQAKYWGSLMIVGGIISLFAQKMRKHKKEPT